ncbi:MAG: bifunctional diaminohydroxyphosphoribosylaminopyrimidine deaminase/5-amino-6-(5-phosphoribosylamino)uracil reductase RibD [Deltaproteobacteria bacterium]|nr:bifunctional diaminohydroxyphosphoribosylaminopyrimidine deaminase/5-amino-6-(5-phosphoribosylamino)uracil reductase RibD [Deltaproteobacteria bacterium]
MKNDEYYIRRALKLAKKGAGRTSPNPMVGAVIVKDGRIIGEGYHACCGENHAEINAIERCVEAIAGADFYITLEPCTHYGKTPPCVDALIKHKPGRVVIGTLDPNPLVAGQGIALLQKQGIETLVGVLEAECRRLNEKFFKFMTTGLPFITLKYAQTLDGRIATATGHSRWISTPESRRYAHRLRSAHDAILVGSGTVLLDDPELTVRLVKGRNPLRIVLDSRLRIPLESRILQNQNQARTMIVTTEKAAKGKLKRLKDMGIELLCANMTKKGEIDLSQLFLKLGQKGVSSVLIEGGSSVITSVLREGLADKLLVIIAPKIVGKGIEGVGDLGITLMDQAITFHEHKFRKLGTDFLLEAKIAVPSL